MKSKEVVVLLTMSALALASACSSSVKVGPQSVAGLTPDGTVDMNEVQVAYIGNAGGGSGTLYYHGQTYPFRIAGLGVGGIGASTVDAEGEVYKLPSLSRFAGSYAQASYGFSLGTASAGDLWMQNEAGVIMHVKAKREGLMLVSAAMRCRSRCSSALGAYRLHSVAGAHAIGGTQQATDSGVAEFPKGRA